VVFGERKLDEEFDQLSQIRRRRLPMSELDAYQEEVFVGMDERFEILSWSRTKTSKYLVLSVVARDFLSLPLSTVPSEFAFNASGRIPADNRSSMTPETIEYLICYKDWLYEYQNAQGN
jgi:hypothetical protein